MSDTTAGPIPEADPPAQNSTATASSPQAPASADMVQSVTNLDRAIKMRRDSDTQLMNYWLYFFLVSWVTFGIYGLVLFFKRTGRIDGFSAR